MSNILGHNGIPLAINGAPITCASAGTDTSDATISSNSQLLYPYTSYGNGIKYTGSIQSQTAQTIYPSTSDQTISSGVYLSGIQTIKGVTTTNVAAGNVKSGVTIEVGDSSDSDRIISVTGEYTSDATISSNSQLLYPYTAYGNGVKYTGNIQSLGATTYYPSTSDQTISSAQYLSGTQTIKGVLLTNLTAGNIKDGVVVEVGDSVDTDRITSITGTYDNSPRIDTVYRRDDYVYGKVSFNVLGEPTFFILECREYVRAGNVGYLLYDGVNKRAGYGSTASNTSLKMDFTATPSFTMSYSNGIYTITCSTPNLYYTTAYGSSTTVPDEYYLTYLY